jgi:hypothetical protein
MKVSLFLNKVLLYLGMNITLISKQNSTGNRKEFVYILKKAYYYLGKSIKMLIN